MSYLILTFLSVIPRQLSHTNAHGNITILDHHGADYVGADVAVVVVVVNFWSAKV